MSSYFNGFIYPPSEDSEQTLLVSKTMLKLRGNTSYVVEIGSGSGYVIGSLAKLVTGPKYIATDIDCSASKATYVNSNRSVDAICCNLMDCIRGLDNALVVFNTPYLWCGEDELSTGDLAYRAICRNYGGDDILDKLGLSIGGGYGLVVTVTMDGLEHLIEVFKSLGSRPMIDLIYVTHMFFEDVVTAHLIVFKRVQ